MSDARASSSRFRQYLTYSNAQFWFWGQDLQHHKKETFLAYGFKRYPPPKRIGGKSMYVLALSQNRFLCLWAFGLMIGETGKAAVFFRRGSLKPKITEKPIPSIPDRYIAFEDLVFLPPQKRPAADGRREFDFGSLQTRLVVEVMRYEIWVENKLGTAYREQCLKRWKHCSFKLESVFPFLIELGMLGRPTQAKLHPLPRHAVSDAPNNNHREKTEL